MQFKANKQIGFMSYDGNQWTNIGNATVQLKKTLLIGIPVTSGIKTVSTILKFDNLSVKKIQ